MSGARKFFVLLYLMRAPIGLLLFLAAAVPLATGVPLLRGMFALESRWEVFWISFIVFMIAAAFAVMTNLVLLYGELRVTASKIPQEQPAQKDWQTITVFFAGMAGALTFVTQLDRYTNLQNSFVRDSLSPGFVFQANIFGFLLAAAVVSASKVLQARFADPQGRTGADPYLVFPVPRIPLVGAALGAWLDRLFLRPPPFRSPLFRVPASRILQLLSFGGEGYFSYLPHHCRILLPGHAYAAYLALLSLGTYFLSGSAHRGELEGAGPPDVSRFPTLFHVLIAVMLAAWLLSAVSFFLDRYRIPVLLPLLIASVVSSDTARSDHVFAVAPGNLPKMIAPSSVLLGRVAPGENNRVIAVAAAGGGIQAAAWTARVLGGLRDQLQDLGFADRVKVISSVSGGAVGSLFYLRRDKLLCGPGLSPGGLSFACATGDSLEGVVWGFTHPDIWRLVAPFLQSPAIDRGWALERTIGKRAAATQENLSEYVRQTSAGGPAWLINTTQAESGAPLVFSTTTFPTGARAGGVVSFADVYSNRDIGIATAVRLSSTFPYVSPAARAQDRGLPQTHFVDGGYYDVSGIATLLAWLSNAMTDQSTPPALDPRFEKTKVLVLRIEPFPKSVQESAKPEAWPYQILAPFLALYAVRGSSQVSRDELEYLQLSESQALKGHLPTVDFRFDPDRGACDERPPLSWHLTQREVQCLENGWADPRNQKVVDSVRRFLRGID